VEAKELHRSEELAILFHRSGGLFKKEGKVPVDIYKRFLFHRDRAGMNVEYEIVNRSPAESRFWFGVEISLSLLAGDDWQRYFIFPGLPVEDRRMVSRGVLPEVESVRLRDESLGLEVSIDVAPASQLWRFPLETISQSESGPEKTYQGTVLLFHWPFSLKAGEKKRFPFSLFCGEI
jgi:alpha-amylase